MKERKLDIVKSLFFCYNIYVTKLHIFLNDKYIIGLKVQLRNVNDKNKNNLYTSTGVFSKQKISLAGLSSFNLETFAGWDFSKQAVKANIRFITQWPKQKRD